MWIMLIKKLPTKPSPPKLSIHWAEPWVNIDALTRQINRIISNYEYNPTIVKDVLAKLNIDKPKRKPKKLTIDAIERLTVDEVIDDPKKAKALNRNREISEVLEEFNSDRIIYEDVWGVEANESKSMGILYNNERIRVQSLEYSIITPENMREYTMTGGSHELVVSDHYSNKNSALNIVDMTPEVKEIKDSLMLDGCTEEEALAVLLGYNIFDKKAEVPVAGWYRCKREYALAYCHDWEIKED